MYLLQQYEPALEEIKAYEESKMGKGRTELLNNVINHLKEYRGDFQKALKVFVLYLVFVLFSLFCDSKTLLQMCILEKLISTAFSSFFYNKSYFQFW